MWEGWHSRKNCTQTRNTQERGATQHRRVIPGAARLRPHNNIRCSFRDRRHRIYAHIHGTRQNERSKQYGKDIDIWSRVPCYLRSGPLNSSCRWGSSSVALTNLRSKKLNVGYKFNITNSQKSAEAAERKERRGSWSDLNHPSENEDKMSSLDDKKTLYAAVEDLNFRLEGPCNLLTHTSKQLAGLSAIYAKPLRPVIFLP